MVIYKITNTINGKVYIGQTTQNPTARWYQHGTCSTSKNTAIGPAIVKYGKENFTFEVLCHTRTIEDLNSLEIDLIKYYNCLSPNGYNVDYGGCNKQRTPETIKKMSLSRSGSKHHMYGKKHSEESKRKTSETLLKNRKFGKDHPNYGKKRSLEFRANMSRSRKGRLGHTPSEETKAKISKSLTGRTGHIPSKQSIEKRSATLKKRYKDNPKGPLTEAHRKKIGEASRKYWSIDTVEKKVKFRLNVARAPLTEIERLAISKRVTEWHRKRKEEKLKNGTDSNGVG